MPDGRILALLAVAGLSGNVGLMMMTGFLPGPPGRWLAATAGVLIVLSMQCIVLLANFDALFRGRHEAEA